MAQAAAVDRQVLLDPSRCIGCRSCAAACFLGHVEAPGLFFEDAWGSGAMPMVCRQCEDAPCVAACPNEAMYEDERGIVRRSPVRCSGCRCCFLACPFGVIDDVVKHQVGSRPCAFCVANRTLCGSQSRVSVLLILLAVVFALATDQLGRFIPELFTCPISAIHRSH